MTPAMADDFYGFLEGIFLNKLRPRVEQKMRNILSRDYMGFPIEDEQFAAMYDVIKAAAAKNELADVITYMTGVDSRKQPLTPEQRHTPGPARCFALLYSGEHAIERIRAKLGDSNQPGSVRSDYGKDVMRNGAHASDSVERALVERQIVGLMGNEISEEVEIINDYLSTINT